jgi:hypothetical protein
MMKDARSVIIGRTDTEELHIGPGEFKGRKYIDIRLFFLPQNSVEMKPTRKGITIDYKELARLVDALQKFIPTK